MHDAVQLQLANYVVCSYNGGDKDKQLLWALVGPCRFGFADDRTKLGKLKGVLDARLPVGTFDAY